MLNKRFFKTKNEAEVTFEFSHPQAEQVSLLGEFNNWQPLAMKFNKKQGVFKCKQRLALDQQFHFRYLINGTIWDNDHQADGYIANDFGTENSIVNTHRSN
jgi:1,4-alpha-glucan branching enzyme